MSVDALKAASGSRVADSAQSSPKTLMRSGTAARLAGLTPSTLRIWEHRYGVVAPPKSASGQRTYSMADVQRLRLIKRLTLAGHAIGTVAGLPHHELVSLASDPREWSPREQRVLVVGHALSQKLAGRLRPAAARVFDDLEQAEREMAACGAADVLVVHIASLHAGVTDRVLALRHELPVPAVLVIYSFGTQAAADALRASGVTVRREPVTGTELARLIVASTARPVPSLDAIGALPGPRLYSDAELVSLAETPSRVVCECPRHLAEIVTLLVGFERYSAECVARNEADAALHRHLHGVTCVARTLFEQALARVVVDEGLAL